MSIVNEVGRTQMKKNGDKTMKIKADSLKRPIKCINIKPVWSGKREDKDH